MEESEQNKRPQDEIPYEVRMKHIIRGYRWLERKLEMIVPYAKHLEKENEALNEELSLKGWKNLQMSEKNAEYRRENKHLKKENQELRNKIEELESRLACSDQIVCDSNDSEIKISIDDLTFDS